MSRTIVKLVPNAYSVNLIRRQLTNFLSAEATHFDEFKRQIEKLGYRLGQVCRVYHQARLEKTALQVWIVLERTPSHNRFREIHFAKDWSIAHDERFRQAA